MSTVGDRLFMTGVFYSLLVAFAQMCAKVVAVYFPYDPIVCFDIIPVIFILQVPTSIAVAGLDSEWAALGILIAIALGGFLNDESRKTAGYYIVLSVFYRWVFLFSAIWYIRQRDGLKFLRNNLAGLHLDKQDQATTIGSNWRWLLSCVIAGIPVNFTGEISWSALGHLLKLTVILLSLTTSKNVTLVCSSPNVNCAFTRLNDWVWKANSGRTVFVLLLISVLAGDLSWRPKNENGNQLNQRSTEAEVEDNRSV